MDFNLICKSLKIKQNREKLVTHSLSCWHFHLCKQQIRNSIMIAVHFHTVDILLDWWVWHEAVYWLIVCQLQSWPRTVAFIHQWILYMLYELVSQFQIIYFTTFFPTWHLGKLPWQLVWYVHREILMLYSFLRLPGLNAFKIWKKQNGSSNVHSFPCQSPTHPLIHSPTCPSNHPTTHLTTQGIPNFHWEALNNVARNHWDSSWTKINCMRLRISQWKIEPRDLRSQGSVRWISLPSGSLLLHGNYMVTFWVPLAPW